jgi:hypothetical protein
MNKRVRLSQGKLTVFDGPFAQAKEVVGGYAQFEFKSKEERSRWRCALWNFTRNAGPAARCSVRRTLLPGHRNGPAYGMGHEPGVVVRVALRSWWEEDANFPPSR